MHFWSLQATSQKHPPDERADIDRAEGEVKRLELALRARLAATYDRYLDTLGLVERYQRLMVRVLGNGFSARQETPAGERQAA